ncbi:potassium transporter 11-like [Papaver somniferum]|uniref:potassium transporter 11-like n=1 Tax=Papaver somniferum TaxID=3469 RepID=UPI000E7031C0|nr:potassium transporter 11-like [Papaver somniferum]
MWQEYVKKLDWHPFKVVVEDGESRILEASALLVYGNMIAQLSSSESFLSSFVHRYLIRGGCRSLGGIMLSIIGTEALSADLGHFPVSAVQLAFTMFVFPCVLLPLQDNLLTSSKISVMWLMHSTFYTMSLPNSCIGIS